MLNFAENLIVARAQPAMTQPPLPAFSENVPKAMLLLLPVVRLTCVFAARVMFALNVIAPLLASPMLIVPAVIWSSSASVSPS